MIKYNCVTTGCGGAETQVLRKMTGVTVRPKSKSTLLSHKNRYKKGAGGESGVKDRQGQNRQMRDTN